MSHKKISKKSKMIAATAFLLGVIAVGGGAVAHADAATTTTAPMSDLVTAIAQKFDLNPSDVQSVVNQVMADKSAQRQASAQTSFANTLAKAVTAGKLTQAQADLVLAKEKDVQATIAGLKGDTAAQRKTAMTALQTSLTTWATDNNIPQTYLRFVGGFRGMRMHRLTKSTS